MQRQEQRLLPQMLQSIEVLQLATDELLALVAQEVAGNEVLELGPAPDGAEASAPVDASAESGDGERGSDHIGERAADDGDRDSKRAFLESQPAPVRSLLQHVREQVAFLGLAPELTEGIAAIAGLLDERGLLPIAEAELPAAAGLEPALATAALDVLRTLEPCGLGACSGVDAMLRQAQGDPDFDVIERLLTQHLDALARNKLPEVARALRLEVDELAALIDRIAGLDPSPGSAFRDGTATIVEPDVRAWLADGQVCVALTGGRVPDLQIDRGYESMATDRSTERAVRDYLKQKVRSARDLIAAIELRQSTLRLVAHAVMQRQREFLLGGRRYLRPLGMAEIADELGMHASTVSRAIAGKYVSTDLGTFLLRDFFDGARERDQQAAGQGRGAVAQRIADLVAQEDKQSPLSDDDLGRALAAQGIQVARRTITKFRRELGIASSYQRRSHGGRRP